MAPNEVNDYDSKRDEAILNGHAYHQNLPPHYIDDDGIPRVTKYADRKARAVVRLVHSIRLRVDLYSDVEQSQAEEVMDTIDGDVGGDDDDDEFDESNGTGNDSMEKIIRKCERISSLMSSLETLKYGGISQKEMCHMVLHTLKLCSATIRYNSANTDENNYTLNFDNVGQLYTIEDGKATAIFHESVDTDNESYETSSSLLHKNDLKESFALPSPAREALLSFVIMILTKDRYLRSVSNQSFSVPDEEGFTGERNDSLLLVINWKALLRILLRTAPYLDEFETGKPHNDSLSRQSTVLKRTISIIRYSRRFFDQGLEVKQNIVSDKTAREVWNMVKPDLMNQTHSNACYRAMILLHLFHPTRCSSDFYVEVMPTWLESWSSIDRCPEFDFLWINMFCRSRRFVKSTKYDWGALRRRLLTLCGYWLQIPVGGKSSDKSFPRAAEAKSRGIPSRLKTFVRSDSSYQEGVDFVAKVSKLLVFCCGKNDGVEQDSNIDTSTDGTEVSHGTEDILRFFSFVGPYFNPSNTGSWTFPLGIMLHYISFELCRRIGRDNSQETFKRALPKLASIVVEVEPFKRNPKIPDHEIVLILDSILPLCQQALYSKSSHVSRAGEASLLYLAQIDYKICAPLLEFAMRALDISSVTQSHQAPAALSTMNRLILPSLKKSPSILLERLPDILRLSLAGIDSNDEEKTIRTLVFYRTLTSWLPIGHAGKLVDGASLQKTKEDDHWRFGVRGVVDFISHQTDSKAYWDALKRLAPNSILFQPESAQPLDQDSDEVRLATLNLAEEASSAMADWSISFLDRIYSLFRSAGEQEKMGKSHRVATKRSSAEDVSRARHFTRILKECLKQFFAAMDGEIFTCAMNSVRGFLIDETHPLAVKYASALCESISSARGGVDIGQNISPGFSNLVLPLTGDIMNLSTNSVLYRMRCLSGAVRRAGVDVLIYREQILSTLDFALSQQNKHVFKAACKLLRHTLSSQSESYPITTDSCPRVGSTTCLGESAQLNDDKIQWHTPTGMQIDFVAELISRYVYDRIRNISSNSDFIFVEKNTEMDVDAKVSSKHNYLMEWRRCLRILRYTIRGCPGLLLDMDTKDAKENESDPNEDAIKALIMSSSQSSQSLLFSTRERFSRIILALLSLIAKQSSSYDATLRINSIESPRKETPRNVDMTSLIAFDTKICKEVAAISQLLFARRSASFRSQDAINLWKAQKDLNNDRVQLNHRKEIAVVLQKAGRMTPCLNQVYSDGEEGGKCLPRRMISNRVEIFLHSFQRFSSFDIPRRLRRERGLELSASSKIFSPDNYSHIDKLYDSIEKLVDTSDESILTPESVGLVKYEGMLDGMFALACHHNSSVRGYGIRAVEYGISRFGWLTLERVPYLISAIALKDGEHDSKFGVLSCSKLSLQNEPALRKRLSEVLKGVCLIIVVPRVMKEIMSSEEHRMKLIEALCDTQDLISLLPAEEMQKMMSYFHQIFTSFRSRFFTMSHTTKENQMLQEQFLSNLLTLLKEDKKEDSDVSSSLNWRNRLLVCWFVTTLVNKSYFLSGQKDIVNQMWETCIFIIQTEAGQPLQKVALGLFGRLANISQRASGEDYALSLKSLMVKKEFCSNLTKALVYNHREDRSVGGGHHAQWSLGVNEMIRDSSSNLAPKIIFPFLRAGRASSNFKVSHVQLIHIVLTQVGADALGKSVNHLLSMAKELAASPPSEDQRNQLCTSAEIFAGIFVSLFHQEADGNNYAIIWQETLLPFLDTVIELIPSSVLGAFIDAVRYGMAKVSPSSCGPLCAWSISKIETSLWKLEDAESPSATDGFAIQSKWLAIMNVVLIQMDFQTDSVGHTTWNDRLHSIEMYADKETNSSMETGSILKNSWSQVCSRLLPRLLDALGHPYQSCRERIASVLFRIAHCYRNENLTETDGNKSTNPCTLIVSKLLSLSKSTDNTSKTHQHSLITSRLFLSYCVHLGENQREFANYVIPLLPLAFEAIKPSNDEDEAKEDDPEIRMLQAQVVKAYRYTISEISVSCTVIYDSESDVSRVLESLDIVSKHSVWQLRLAVAHYLRCFQGNHKFLFTTRQTKKTTRIVARLLADERREVSAAAMAALTGILAATPLPTVTALVEKYRKKANNSVIRKSNKQIKKQLLVEKTKEEIALAEQKEKVRAVKQQTSVYFLSAAVLATPYDTPAYVPVALAALSKHSYERSAPFAVRETVKMCCGEYKRTHVSDNWEIHRKMFTREQLEALEDVVSTPHYYA